MDFLSEGRRMSEVSSGYDVLAGRGTVLVSAPHRVEHARNGAVKRAEPDTGRLAMLLHERAGCPVVYRCGDSLEDPNYDEASDYRDEIVRLACDEGVRVVLDLHEMGDRHQSMVEIGTGHGRNVDGRFELTDAIVRAFESRGIEPVTVDAIFPAAGPRTVSADVARRSPALCFQIEMNVRLFLEEGGRSDFSVVCDALEEAVGRLNEVLR